jgi:hypothetical protein
MSHILRYFENALDENKAESEHVLMIIRSLYRIECTIREQEATHLREEKSSELKKPQPLCRNYNNGQ